MTGWKLRAMMMDRAPDGVNGGGRDIARGHESHRHAQPDAGKGGHNGDLDTLGETRNQQA